MRRRRAPGRILPKVFAVAVVILLAAGVFLFAPVRLAAGAASDPSASYEAAVQRLGAIQANEDSRYNPKCKTVFLSHGQKTAGVVALVHGYTDCPYQYHALAPQLFDLGYNVLVMPLPHHGLADRLNEEQGGLTAEELAAYAGQVVDIAQGLGDEVTLVGISGGGLVTGWAAQQRSDIHRAILISPAFGFQVVPTALTLPAMRVYSLLPNQFTWWDPVQQADNGSDTDYPRYATHSLAQTLRLGFAVTAAARRSPPAAGSLVVVTNANDQQVNREMIDRMVALWQKSAPGKVSTYEFPAELGLAHDLIGPGAYNARPDVVYPKLIELIQAP